MATASVLLTNLIGLSRVSFAMARNNQLPKTISKVSSRFGTPYLTVLAMGILLAVLTFILDLKQSAAITSFSILSTHLAVNLSVIRLRKKMPKAVRFKSPLYPLIPSLGFFSCVILMFSLPPESWVVVASVGAISAALFLITRKNAKAAS